ncbi:hypothetical protein HAX54_020108 [Datura stramonium]|uniref:Uncharacterized protein n=1 Tax=Datura stramonium TaxID=4076 RepID=A0ABS8UQK1_DATST|nr:hypothetical protein [Datura stramonium]
MKFNESTSPDSQREKTITEIDHGVSDRIELEIESLLAEPSSSKVEKVEKVQNLNQEDNVDALVQQQSYSIATETIDVLEPNSYKEAISTSKVD